MGKYGINRALFVSSDSKVTFSHSITLKVSQFKHKRYEQDKYYRYSSIEREGTGVCHEGGTYQRQTRSVALLHHDQQGHPEER